MLLVVVNVVLCWSVACGLCWLLVVWLLNSSFLSSVGALGWLLTLPLLTLLLLADGFGRSLLVVAATSVPWVA